MADNDGLEYVGFVSEDKAIRDRRTKTRLGAGDFEVIESVRSGQHLIPITSGKQLKMIMEALVVVFEDYEEQCRQSMTHDQALFIRGIRVGSDYSWRAVAEACHDQKWPGWAPWEPPSSQPMGMALCERAADFFDEDWEGEPWN